MTVIANKNLKKLFYNGNYSELEKIFVSHDYSFKIDVNTCYIIMGLTRLGKISEAQVLWEKMNAVLEVPVVLRIQIFFYFCIEGIRTKNRDLIESSFKQISSLRFMEGKIGNYANFYLSQLISFSAFFKAKYKQSERLSLKAIKIAVGLSDNYMCYLSYDLLGHGVVKQGRYLKGMAYLKTALKYAEKSGSLRAINAESISIAVYQSNFGVSPKLALMNLKKCLERHCEDTYTTSKIHLELAYQYILKGQFKIADQSLKEAKNFIDVHKIAAQESQYHYLIALKYFFQGELEFSSRYLQTYFYDFDRKSPIYSEVSRLKICHEYFSSQLKSNEIKFEITDNQIGNLFQKCLMQDVSILDEITSSRYYSFLRLLYKLSPNKDIIFTDSWHDKIVFCFKDEIYIAKQKLNNMQIKLLNLLVHNKNCSKELIASSLWGFVYRKRHDQMIYPLVSSLRKALGKMSTLIGLENGSYFLTTPILIFQNTLIEKKNENKQPMEIEGKAELNARQVTLLRKLKADDWIDSQRMQQWFNISRATATRDLTELKNFGYLNSFGKARGIQYCKSGTE